MNTCTQVLFLTILLKHTSTHIQHKLSFTVLILIVFGKTYIEFSLPLIINPSFFDIIADRVRPFGRDIYRERESPQTNNKYDLHTNILTTHTEYKSVV